MNRIVVRSERNFQTAIHIRDHVVMTDEPVDVGGDDLGPMPLELFVGTLGACIAVTTRAYAKRKNWPLEEISIEIEMERFKREDYPNYTGDASFINEIREHIRFKGTLSDEQKEQLLKVAGRCPVHLALEHPVFFIEKLVNDEPIR